MPIRSAINDLVPDTRAWRRELHQNPELMYDVFALSAATR
jgi:metal-dependent amidase/aminoacylase/carboxypeptidase family protein